VDTPNECRSKLRSDFTAARREVKRKQLSRLVREAECERVSRDDDKEDF